MYVLLILAGFFRFYHIRENLFFEGELGHNYLAIKNFFVNHALPLIGPPTSHEWLSFGPLFYWLFGPILAAGGYHPIIGAIFFAFVGSLVPVLNYYFVKKYISSVAATYSSLLLVVSPFLLLITRQSRFFSLVLPLTYLLLYVFFNQKKTSSTKSIVATGLLFGAIIHFHLSPIILLPGLLLTIYLNRALYTRYAICMAIGAFLLPQLPLLVYDAQHNFSMLRNITLWFPYRIAGFLGLYPKNTLDTATALQNFQAIWHVLTQVVIQEYVVFTTLLVLGVVYSVIRATRGVPSQKRRLYVQLHILFCSGLIGIFIHGKPPYHYFLPLIPFVFIYVAIAFDYLYQVHKRLEVLKVVTVLIFLVNIMYLFSIDWYNLTGAATSSRGVVPFSAQERIAREIVRDTNKKQYTLERKGPNDHFAGDFAQNYRYLMWYFGNEPVEKAITHYVIVEDNAGNVRIEKYQK